MVSRISNYLNTIMFGARISSDPDVVSQWGTIAVSYILNLILILAVVVPVFTIAGYYEPFAAPFADPALRIVLATANVLTFALTYVASLSWRASLNAIERQRAANRSKAEYIILISLIAGASFVFLSVLFLVLNIAALIASACINSALLQMLISRRTLKSPNPE